MFESILNKNCTLYGVIFITTLKCSDLEKKVTPNPLFN